MDPIRRNRSSSWMLGGALAVIGCGAPEAPVLEMRSGMTMTAGYGESGYPVTASSTAGDDGGVGMTYGVQDVGVSSFGDTGAGDGSVPDVGTPDLGTGGMDDGGMGTSVFVDDLGGYGGSDCCYEGASAGCSDAICESIVCMDDAYCCSSEWDALCMEATVEIPECGCPLMEGLGDLCDVAGSTPGCDDSTCEEGVCEGDPFCCNAGWDELCVASGGGTTSGGGGSTSGGDGTTSGGDGTTSGGDDGETEGEAEKIKVLITGFDPFTGFPYNPSSGVLDEIETELGTRLGDGYELTTKNLKVQASVTAGRRQARTAKLLDDTYDVVVSMGVQPGATIRVETSAVNTFLPLTGRFAGMRSFPIQGRRNQMAQTTSGTAVPTLPGTSGEWTVETGGAGTGGTNDCNFTYWMLCKNPRNEGFFVHVPNVAAAKEDDLATALVPVLEALIESTQTP